MTENSASTMPRLRKAPRPTVQGLCAAIFLSTLTTAHVSASTSAQKNIQDATRNLLRAGNAGDVNDDLEIREAMEKVFDDVFIGCYRDSSTVPAMEYDSLSILEVRSCLMLCLSHNFDYAGLRDKEDCFCDNGNSYGRYGEADLDLDCNKPDCKEYEMCLGIGKLAVFATQTLHASARRTSWFNAPDSLNGKVFANEPSSTESPTGFVTENPSGIASFDLSMDNAQSNYAGTPTMSPTEDRNTESPTEAPFTLPLFDQLGAVLGITEEDPDVYIGCYVDMEQYPAMTFKSHSNHNVESCRQYCGETMFRYAGLEAANICYCANIYNKYGKADHDNECDMTCSLGNRGICGGVGRLSVYHSIPDTMAPSVHPTSAPTPEQYGESGYIGCYRDNLEAHALSHKAKDAHKIESCIEYCWDMEFGYAGLSNATECYCGNSYDGYGLADSEMECNMICSQGGGMCGGIARLSVFATSQDTAERKLWS
jgi:WSC domain